MSDSQVQVREIATGRLISVSPSVASRFVAESGYTYAPVNPKHFPDPPLDGPCVKVREIATGYVFCTTPIDGREAVEHPAGGFEYADAGAAVTEFNADGTVKAGPGFPAPVGVAPAGVFDAAGHPLTQDTAGAWFRTDTGAPATPARVV
jgi:hypothetical protein